MVGLRLKYGLNSLTLLLLKVGKGGPLGSRISLLFCFLFCFALFFVLFCFVLFVLFCFVLFCFFFLRLLLKRMNILTTVF